MTFGTHMAVLLDDCRCTYKTIRRDPKLAVFVVATLAFALCLNTVVFSFVNTLLLRQLPFHDPQRIYAIQRPFEIGLGGFGSRTDFSVAAESLRSLESVAICRAEGVTLSGVGVSRRVLATVTSAKIFDVLGTPPMIGRAFRPEEDVQGDDRVAAITFHAWKNFFNSDPKVLGRSVQVNGVIFTIIAVLPPAVSYPSGSDLWLPTVFDPMALHTLGGLGVQAIGRLRPGASVSSAQAELRQHSQHGASPAASFVPLSGELTRAVRPPLLALIGAVTLVLLVACANVASLLLSRAIDNRKEFAIRAALGASPNRLMQQQLVFGVSLALAAGGLGTLLSFWGIRLLYAARPASLESLAIPAMNWAVLFYTGLLSLVAGMLCWFLPARLAGRQQETAALRATAPQITDHYIRLRQALIVVEISFAFTLVIAAGLLIRSVQKLNQVALGFDVQDTLTFSTSLQGDAYATGSNVQAFYRKVLRRLRDLPEVTSAGATNYIPLGNAMEMGLPVVPDGETSRQTVGLLRIVSSDYFRSLGVPLLIGRDISDADTPGTPKVIIVNELLAAELWPHDSALGRYVTFGGSTDPQQTYTVIGVVPSGRHGGPRGGAAPEYFLPLSQEPWPSMTFVLRIKGGDLSPVTRSVRQAVAAVDPDQPVFDLKTMDTRVQSSESLERFLRSILATFAGFSLLLATTGLYGMLRYTLSRRTREIGIRMALGAEPTRITRGIVSQGLLLCTIALAVGITLATLLSNFLRATLFGISAKDPLTYASVSAVFLAVTALASFQLGHRASRVNPAVSIREQ